jgi:hypothetical protein
VQAVLGCSMLPDPEPDNPFLSAGCLAHFVSLVLPLLVRCIVLSAPSSVPQVESLPSAVSRPVLERSVRAVLEQSFSVAPGSVPHPARLIPEAVRSGFLVLGCQGVEGVCDRQPWQST